MKRFWACLFVVILALATITLMKVSDNADGQDMPQCRNRNQITNNSEQLIIPVGEYLEMHGEHNYTGTVYINGTLNITAYNDQQGTTTGTLRINAGEVFINGLIDGRGRGYGGGGGGGGFCTSNSAFGYGGKGGINGNGGNGGNGDQSNGYGGGGGSNGGLGGGGLGVGGTGDEKRGGSGARNGGTYSGGNMFGSGGGGGDGDGGGGGGGGGVGGDDGSNGNVNDRKGGNGSGPGGGNWYGGDGGYLSPGTNGDSTFDFNVYMGSGGGGGRGRSGSWSQDRYSCGGGGGGAGGGSVTFFAVGDVVINGQILTGGSWGGSGGYSNSGGHGGGGGVAIRGNHIYNNGLINTMTRVGGTLKLFYHSYSEGPGCVKQASRIYYRYVNDKPTAILSSNNNVILKDSPILLSGTNSSDPDGEVNSYNFDFGDGYTSGWTPSATVSHSYSKSGDYNVSLQVKDDDGALSKRSANLTIHVNYPPIPRLMTTTPSGQVGEVIALNGATSTDLEGSVSEYYFEYGDGQNSGWIDAAETIHIYNEIGAYYVTMRVEDDDGAVSENTSSVRIDITETGEGYINTPPVANLTVDRNSVMTGISVCFDGGGSTDYEGPVTNYFFDFGDGSNSGWISSSFIYHSYDRAGNYLTTLQVRDKGGLMSEVRPSEEIRVEPNQPPIPSVLQEPGFTINSVQLSWSPNTDPDYATYEIHRSVIRLFTPSSDTLMYTILNRSLTDFSLTNIYKPYSYYYRLRTVDTAGYVADSNIVPEVNESGEDGEDGSGPIISDESTAIFSNSVQVQGELFVTNNSIVTIIPPFDAVNPVLHYWIDEGSSLIYREPFTVSGLDEGLHVIQYYSQVDNTTEHTRATYFIIDASPPELNVVVPLSGSVQASSILELKWNSSDTISGIDHFEIKTDDRSWDELGTERVHAISGLSDGMHIVKVRAIDKLGLKREKKIDITVDTTSPDLNILTPAPSTTFNSNKITVIWILNDAISSNITLSIQLDNLPTEIVSSSTSHIFSNLEDGIHVVTMEATDQVGNKKIAVVSFTIRTDMETTSKSSDETTFSIIDTIMLFMILISMLFVIFYVLLSKRREKGKEKDENRFAEKSEITFPSAVQKDRPRNEIHPLTTGKEKNTALPGPMDHPQLKGLETTAASLPAPSSDAVGLLALPLSGTLQGPDQTLPMGSASPEISNIQPKSGRYTTGPDQSIPFATASPYQQSVKQGGVDIIPQSVFPKMVVSTPQSTVNPPPPP